LASFRNSGRSEHSDGDGPEAVVLVPLPQVHPRHCGRNVPNVKSSQRELTCVCRWQRKVWEGTGNIRKFHPPLRSTLPPECLSPPPPIFLHPPILPKSTFEYSRYTVPVLDIYGTSHKLSPDVRKVGRVFRASFMNQIPGHGMWQ
jgi:hypothetical protein